MGQHSINQLLADILTNIEAARRYIGSLSSEEFHANEMIVDAVQLRMQNASEATRRLKKEWPEQMDDLEKRYSDVPWKELREFSSISRHGYDIIEAEYLWEDLQPCGDLTRVEMAVLAEVALANLPPIAEI